MKTATKLQLSDVAGLSYQTLPQDQGQIVTYSYAIFGNWPGYLVCRRHDGSDGEVSYTAERISRRASDDDFEPWNGLIPATVGRTITIR